MRRPQTKEPLENVLPFKEEGGDCEHVVEMRDSPVPLVRRLSEFQNSTDIKQICLQEAAAAGFLTIAGWGNSRDHGEPRPGKQMCHCMPCHAVSHLVLHLQCALVPEVFV